MTLTENTAPGRSAAFAKGSTVASGSRGYAEISALFDDSSKISLSLDKNSASLFYPVLVDGNIRYVLYLDIDSSGYFETRHMLEEPMSQLLGESAVLNIVSSAAVAALLVFFTVIISLMVSRLLRPIGFFTQLLASFAEGDFSIAVPQKFLKRKDEMGQMAESFRNTTEKMQALFSVIREQAGSLSHIGDELASNMLETAASVNEITANIKSMKTRAASQAAGVTETGEAMGHIMQSINNLNKNISVQAE
ncbi:MAG: methyl-accepting chemotaxis protein, partial [Treponema sp.]|nr:methyl-accepting chemotaxis protein [Treponema sp.]